MVTLVPVIELFTVSVAVMVWAPIVSRVAENVPVPAVRVLLAGRVAAASVLVKWTVPAYAVAVLPKASCAVTVKLNGLREVAVAGAGTAKCVGGGAAAV